MSFLDTLVDEVWLLALSEFHEVKADEVGGSGGSLNSIESSQASKNVTSSWISEKEKDEKDFVF